MKEPEMSNTVQKEVDFERWIVNASRSKLERTLTRLRAIKFTPVEQSKAQVLIGKMESELFTRAVTIILRA
jgi:hypothetical protein